MVKNIQVAAVRKGNKWKMAVIEDGNLVDTAVTDSDTEFLAPLFAALMNPVEGRSVSFNVTVKDVPGGQTKTEG